MRVIKTEQKRTTLRAVKRILLLVYVIVGSMFACGVVFVYLVFVRPENTLREALDIYPDAQLIFEDQARFGAGVGQKSLYYWSADGLEVVRLYYETDGLVFVRENAASQWLISGFYLDGSPLAVASAPRLDHESFCNYRQPYQCVTISLVDGSASDLYRLPPISPSNFKYLTPPPSLLSMPQRGTLIVFSFYQSMG